MNTPTPHTSAAGLGAALAHAGTGPDNDPEAAGDLLAAIAGALAADPGLPDQTRQPSD